MCGNQLSAAFHDSLDLKSTGSMPSTIRRHPSAPPAARSLTTDEQTLGQYIPLLYHYNMLQDEDRVGAFREAIDLVVKPGMHVVELGGGTGILSSLAARRGARVTCVERNPELVACARRFILANGLADNVNIIQADAMMFTPEAPVDVVICEMLHVGLLREKQAAVISAFKRNYLRAYETPLPLFMPEASILLIQPVEHDFNFAGYVAPVPLFQAPLISQPRTTELGKLEPYASIAYEEAIPNRFGVEQTVTAIATGSLNAVRLITQNVIAIDTDHQHAITWPNQCLVLPLDSPTDVRSGQSIQIVFDYVAGGSIESLIESLQVKTLPAN